MERRIEWFWMLDEREKGGSFCSNALMDWLIDGLTLGPSTPCGACGLLFTPSLPPPVICRCGGESGQQSRSHVQLSLFLFFSLSASLALTHLLIHSSSPFFFFLVLRREGLARLTHSTHFTLPLSPSSDLYAIRLSTVPGLENRRRRRRRQRRLLVALSWLFTYLPTFLPIQDIQRKNVTNHLRRQSSQCSSRHHHSRRHFRRRLSSENLYEN